MDYSSFRQTSAKGQAVSVNHRALITRALTKYPVDHALFRELLQNSADAKANTATIQFSTSSYDTRAASIHNIPINRLRFSNDGIDFNDDDWRRLKEIASGNPNESKIGAFGVGFYSLFELTDEPLVHSGYRIVNFRYEGVQLNYFDLEAPAYQKGTLIDLPYSHEGKLENIGDFIGFLIQNFLLVNLNGIKVEILYANGIKNILLHLSKEDGLTDQIPLPPTFSYSRSPFFRLEGVKKTDFMVRASYMNAAYMPPLTLSKGVFSLGKQLFSTLTDTPKDPDGSTEFHCKLLRVDAVIVVGLSTKFKEKLTESLLKSPPRRSVISLLSISDSDSVSHSGAASMNSKLRPYVFPEDPNDAKIFIGFSTKQSTGFRSHLALQSAVPTMERTAIDLSHNYVKEWNLELLQMAGAVARVTYESELDRCRLAGAADGGKGLAESIENAKSVCSRFKFAQSAPDKTISDYVRAGFYHCAHQSLVPSSRGVLCNTQVKFTDKELVPLLKNTPVIEDIELAENLAKFVRISKVTAEEIARDIQTSPLTMEEAKKYVTWMGKNIDNITPNERVSLASALKIKIPLSHQDKGNHERTASAKIIDIGSATSYHDRSILYSTIVSNNLPRKCLSSDIAQDIGPENLRTIFGVHPLSVEDWIGLRVKDLQDLSSSKSPSQTAMTEIAFEILQIASECWSQLNSDMRSMVVEHLNSVKCIPTNMGLHYPRDCYIEPIKGFTNFPVVTKKFSPDWLEAIGVRKSMNMRFVLDKISRSELDWSNADLINYLTANQKSLKGGDWKILIESPFFRCSNQSGLFRASALYAPDETLMELGFPTLDYDGWSRSFRSAILMDKLKLKRFPSAEDLFQRAICCHKSETAIAYFLVNYVEAKYSAQDVQKLRFIPTTKLGMLACPAECYWDPSVEVFDKFVISSRFASAAAQLGVRKGPPTRSLLHEVLGNPQIYLSSVSKRENIFGYFAQHSDEISSSDISFCKQKRFLPLRYPTTDELVWHTPTEVYLPTLDNDPSLDKLRPLLPTYVPNKRSIPFLTLLGISDKPNPRQLVNLMIRDPVGAYQRLNNREVYEQALCLIGANWQYFASDDDLLGVMKQSPFLLGEKYTGKISEVQVSLYRPSELVLVDDAIIFNQFKSMIVTAPQDEDIENLYRKLGTPRLSTLLKERFSYRDEFEDQTLYTDLKERIQERLKLFIENTKSSLKSKKSEVNLKLVRRIEVERQLPPHRAIKSPTTCCYDRNANVLLISPQNLDWLDVANALCKKIMERPDQDSVVVLELQLSAPLSALERKGYNIERLRRPQRSNKSLESFLKPPSSQTPQPPSMLPQAVAAHQNHGMQQLSSSIPGAFPQPTKKEISNLPQLNEKQTGGAPLVEAGSTGEIISSWVGKMFGKGPRGLNNVNLDQTQQHQIEGLHRSLQQGVSDVRQYNEHTIRSSGGADTGGHVFSEDPNIKCGSDLEHNLSLCKTLTNGIRVFQDYANTQPRQDELALSEKLLWLAEIFRLPPQSIQLFREKSVTIAFNKGGSLFFNSYHLSDTENELDFWYTIMAHEIAHNMCQPHNATHSFYTEGYIRHSLRRYISHNSR